MRIEKRIAGRWGWFFAAVAILGLTAVAVAAEELCVPLDVITIEAPAGVAAERSPVDFPHGQHFSMACTECHHKWQGTDENLSCATAGCHDLTAAPKKGSGIPDRRYYKNAFHRSCIGCHKKIKTANLEAEAAKSVNTVILPGGPTGCVECHPR
ncbi:MAG TPA: hypothetical protein ENF48_03325 [Desulfobacteraceae bacterium]|nr:cytochrome c3 family protein [Deltaproteobacteria bacterium]MBW2355165.1 cytochrome c3 family protein [Deltaproteobacteria bacterium]RLB98597.1 MAG: hypothetical protein DRH76_02115 [Deltaproteobacteria bacterium]HDI59381.1 hypothetical protein [Desulfobacteraceae bacterium]